MKRFLKIAAYMAVAIISMTFVQSCSKEDSGLKGWYATSEESGYYGMGAYFYEFKNNNTVLYYGFMYRSIEVDDGTVWNKADINGSTWYYCNSPNTYSYVTDGTQIIIPSQGVILIKSGNALVRDGSSETYYKK